jgi:undecaprenyl-diphosphatase
MMRYITHLGGTTATVLPALLLIALGGTERSLGLAMLVANAASAIPVQVLKRLVARPRPCDALGQPLALVPLPDPFSFPSGHSAAAAAVSITASLAHPWLAPVLLPLSSLVALSRVTLRVHHIGDVVAGCMLGAGGSGIATLLIT